MYEKDELVLNVASIAHNLYIRREQHTISDLNVALMTQIKVQSGPCTKIVAQFCSKLI
jgi:hypothetical protein